MGENSIPHAHSFGSRVHSIVLLFEAPSTVKWLVCTSHQNQIKVVRIRKPTHLWNDGCTVQQHHKFLHETFTCMCPREAGKTQQTRLQFKVATLIVSNPVCSKCKVQCPIIVRPEVWSNEICPSTF